MFNQCFTAFSLHSILKLDLEKGSKEFSKSYGWTVRRPQAICFNPKREHSYARTRIEAEEIGAPEQAL